MSKANGITRGDRGRIGAGWYWRFEGKESPVCYATRRIATESYIEHVRKTKYAELLAGKTLEQCCSIMGVNPL